MVFFFLCLRLILTFPFFFLIRFQYVSGFPSKKKISKKKNFPLPMALSITAALCTYARWAIKRTKAKNTRLAIFFFFWGFFFSPRLPTTTKKINFARPLRLCVCVFDCVRVCVDMLPNELEPI